MGISVTASIAFGVNVGDGDIEDEKLEELMERFGYCFGDDLIPEIELLIHSSYDCSEYIVGIRSTYKHADWGDPTSLDPFHMSGDMVAMTKTIKDFLKEHNLGSEENKEPSWLIFSLMG